MYADGEYDLAGFASGRRGQDSWGAVITLESVPAGRYQIALSEEASVEAIQDSGRLPIGRPSGRTVECRGVRRSFEIEVKGEPLTLQLGGAGVRRMNIAVVPDLAASSGAGDHWTARQACSSIGRYWSCPPAATGHGRAARPCVIERGEQKLLVPSRSSLRSGTTPLLRRPHISLPALSF